MTEPNTDNSPCIWLVDDESDLVDTTCQILSDAGYECRGFLDPREALAALDAGEQPDLFLIDLRMPHMTGSEMIRDLRTRGELATTPIIVLTALTTESSTLNAFEAGADDVVRKPLTTAELLARVRGQLARQSRLEELRTQNRDLKVVTDLAHVLSQGTELPDILRTLVDGLRTALAIDEAAIYLLHEETGELHRALPSDPSRSEGSPNTTLDLRRLRQTADTLAARRTAFLDEAETRQLLEVIGGAHPRRQQMSSAIVPLLHREQFVGVIVTVADRENLGVTSRERFLFSIISSLAAVAVHRAELFHRIIQEHAGLDAANRELAETRDFLDNVIQSSPDAIVASNRPGKIVVYNRAAERILGWTPEEAIGQDVRLLYPDGGAEGIFKKLRSPEHGGKGRLERSRGVVVNRHGEEIPVEISASLLYSNDSISAAVGIFTDLRGRLRMEERLQEATENLEETRRQAVAAELAGAAAHELNQPLTSLLSYAELLTGTVAAGGKEARAVEAINRDATRMVEIVKKIGKITDYRTKEYVGGARIVDLGGDDDDEGTAEQS